MVKISLKLALGILGSVIGWRILAGMVTLGWGPTPTVATASSIPPPVMSIYISNGLFDTYLARVGIQLSFGASVDWPGGPGIPVDFYLGAITPDKRIFSWVQDTGGTRLTEGVAPIAQGVTALSFTSEEARYTFSGGEVPGMYLVFTLIAPPGADISAAGGWNYAIMVPLIFQP